MESLITCELAFKGSVIGLGNGLDKPNSSQVQNMYYIGLRLKKG